MTAYRLFPSTNGPSAATVYAGPYVAGVMFDVTSGGLWFTGYWWWVCSTGQDTAAGVKFALWQLVSASSGSVVPGSTVTAGALTAGAWNFVPLATPLLLTPCGSNSYGSVYLAAVGYTAAQGFPETKNQFGAGQPYAAGITSGPLTAPSSSSGTAAAGSAYAWTKPQCPFSVTGSDPAAVMPVANDSDANLWLDVQVSTAGPPNASYRGFPNSPAFVVPGSGPQALAYTIGLQFTLGQVCSLTRIWHYSPPGVTILPSRCAIWDVVTQTVVTGSDNQSPAWSGAAGSGWVSCSYTGVTLIPGRPYKAAVFTSDNVHAWFLAQASFWGGTPGPFSSGITQGPLTIAGNSAASPGQDSWNVGTVWTYPATSTNPEFDGLDVEVTPVATTPGTLTAATQAAGGPS